MNFGRCILPLILSFSAIVVNAQNDTVKKSDTSNLKVTVFKKDFIKSGIDISDYRFNAYNHKLYNPDIYRVENLSSFFIGWPTGNNSQNNYRQYSIYHNFYNKPDVSNPYIYSPYYTDSWYGYDPTNPTGASSAGEALILGSINYIFYKVLNGE